MNKKKEESQPNVKPPSPAKQQTSDEDSNPALIDSTDSELDQPRKVELEDFEPAREKARAKKRGALVV